jgi:hypothetical protein
MIGNAELFFDQMGNPPAGPQRCFKTQPLGTLLEQLHQTLLIVGVEQRLAPGSSGFVERRLPTGRILLPPPAHGLVADLQPTADLAVVELFAKQLHRRQSPLFERKEIAPHASWIAHTN